MKPLTLEWIEKAEADLLSACREFRARKNPNYDAACFFAQQCVEKYLKAAWVEAALIPPRTHDLGLLLKALLDRYPLWADYREAMERLTSYAVEFRYPGERATHAMAKIATQQAIAILKQLRADLSGIPAQRRLAEPPAVT